MFHWLDKTKDKIDFQHNDKDRTCLFVKIMYQWVMIWMTNFQIRRPILFYGLCSSSSDKSLLIDSVGFTREKYVRIWSTGLKYLWKLHTSLYSHTTLWARPCKWPLRRCSERRYLFVIGYRTRNRSLQIRKNHSLEKSLCITLMMKIIWTK